MSLDYHTLHGLQISVVHEAIDAIDTGSHRYRSGVVKNPIDNLQPAQVGDVNHGAVAVKKGSVKTDDGVAAMPSHLSGVVDTQGRGVSSQRAEVGGGIKGDGIRERYNPNAKQPDYTA